MPARSWSKGTDHAAQHPRRPYDNQYSKYCSVCSAWHLHAKGRKYYTCLTCGTRTERGSPTIRAVDLPKAGENFKPCPLCGTQLPVQDLPDTASR